MLSILGQDQESHFVQPPLSMNEDLERPGPASPHKNHSLDIYDRDNKARDFVVSGAHDTGDFQRRRAEREDISKNTPSSAEMNAESRVPVENEKTQNQQNIVAEPAAISTSPSLGSRTDTPTKASISEGTRGHARDPLEEEHLYLFIGPSTYSEPPTCPTSRSASFRGDDGELKIDTSVGGIPIPDSETQVDMSAIPIVSESPGATDFDIYETAYTEEIERIRSKSRDSSGPQPTMYLTRRMERNRSRLGDIMQLVREAEAAEKNKKLSTDESEPQTQEPSSAAPDTTAISKDSETQAAKPTSEQSAEADTTSQPEPTIERKNSTSVSSPSTDASGSATARRSTSGLRGLVGRLRGKGLDNMKDGGGGGGEGGLRD